MSAWARGIDDGKLVKDNKVLVICDKHSSLLELELQPANTDDRAGILPADCSWDGKRLSNRDLRLGIIQSDTVRLTPCYRLT
jgi:hypothetical protein